MAEISAVAPVKLFFGILFNSSSYIEEIKSCLEGLYGPADYISPEFPFDFTDYYEGEMGGNIKRIFFSFEKLIMADTIKEIKLESNELEGKFIFQGKRAVNLDPGYFDYHKLVLASAKFGGQKVYIGKGIYADITLWYQKGKFTTFPWTFLDFKSGLYDEVFLHIRHLYKKKRKGLT